MKKLWELKLGKRKVSNIAFCSNRIILGLGNELICLDLEGVVWNQKMHATFYRDPYSDVTITALDADQSYIIAGTNFMDGKVYLFTADGRLQWMHQFATIASLGWRPDDVTAVKINGNFVAVGTEFMNEYVHVYTINRKRVFQRRVVGKVEDFSFVRNKLAVGTNNRLCVFNMDGREECSIKIPVKKVEVVNDKIIVLNNYGIIVYKFKNKDGFKIKRYWSVKAYNPISCIAGEDMLIASENLLNYISKSGEVIWQKVLDVPVLSLFYDNLSNKIYVGMENKVQTFSDDGELAGDFKFEGKPLKIGKIGRLEDVVATIHKNGSISLYKIQC